LQDARGLKHDPKHFSTFLVYLFTISFHNEEQGESQSMATKKAVKKAAPKKAAVKKAAPKKAAPAKKAAKKVVKKA